jgi:hypothetical protein
MSIDIANRVITTSVRMPVEMRSKIEHVRLARAQRGLKLPRLRDLVLEALGLLCELEATRMASTTEAMP